VKIQFVSWWERLRESYWALPTFMATAACVLAHGAIKADRFFQESGWDLPEWMYAGGAEGARTLLSSIVNSMMGVTGVVFSIAVVVLTLASNQFGPHLLRNFIRNRGNQFTLGTFISTFVYALLILRTVYEQEKVNFVPSTGITLAVVLTLISTAVLIFFIHHISTQIQADAVIAEVDRELNQTIDRLSKQNKHAPETVLPKNFDKSLAGVKSTRSNYIALIDTDAALEIASENDIIIRFNHRPGKYVPAGGMLASVWPAEKLNEKLADRIRATCILEARRTPQQDVEYGILQLVEIAVRALSTGQNDPFTAITCIDRLGSVIRRLAKEPVETASLSDSGGLRVVVQTSDFEGQLNAAFDQIRQNAGSSVAVLARLMEALAMVAEMATTTETVEAVRKQAERVLHAAERDIPETFDLASVRERHRHVLQILETAR
jgi:uncharacterized membrane protein